LTIIEAVLVDGRCGICFRSRIRQPTIQVQRQFSQFGCIFCHLIHMNCFLLLHFLSTVIFSSVVILWLSRNVSLNPHYSEPVIDTNQHNQHHHHYHHHRHHNDYVCAHISTYTFHNVDRYNEILVNAHCL
jgi:hypothetical protein